MASFVIGQSLDYGYLEMYEDGCQKDGVVDCTIACQEPALTWNDTHTLTNCLLYLAIAGLLASDNLTDNGAAQAAEFGIASSNVSVIQRSISSCLDGFCGTLRRHHQWTCDDYVDFPGYSRAHARTLTDFCGTTAWAISTDLGGIGVGDSFMSMLTEG